MRTIIGIACLSLIMSNAVAAQEPASGAEFDAISIRLNRSGPSSAWNRSFPNGRWEYQGGAILGVVMGAFGVSSPHRIIGLPAWAYKDSYSIEAKGAPPSSDRAIADRQEREQLRSMLASRFHLVAHRETRTLPCYTLVVDKGGPKSMQPAGDRTRRSIKGETGHIAFRGTPMPMLAQYLSNLLRQQVVDSTDVTGAYDFDLKFVPDELLAGLSQPAGGAASAPSDTLFAALQRQLGLRLVSKTLPEAEVIVIDRIDRPEEN